MTDLHTHILPKMDDGSDGEETSGRILLSLASQGVDRVVFTSHYYQHRESVDSFIERRNAAYEKILPLIPQNMQTKLAAEVHFSHMAVSNDELAKLKIENTKYILLEFSKLNEWEHHLLQRVERFMDETDLIPVIAHAEVYLSVRKNPSLVADLIDMGCLIQSNCSSFFLKPCRQLLMKMLERNMVHCLGTDTHNMETSPPFYEKATALIRG